MLFVAFCKRALSVSLNRLITLLESGWQVGLFSVYRGGLKVQALGV